MKKHGISAAKNKFLPSLARGVAIKEEEKRRVQGSTSPSELGKTYLAAAPNWIASLTLAMTKIYEELTAHYV